MGKCIGIHTSLINLKLRCLSDVSSVNLEMLCRGIARNKKIESLEFSNNNLDWSMLRTLARNAFFDGNFLQYLNPSCKLLCPPEVQVLTLERCGINDQKLSLLVSGLERNTSLHSLFLFDNPRITACGWRSLASILRSNSGLKTLGVWNPSINDEAAIALADGLQTNTKLTTLRILQGPDLLRMARRATPHITKRGYDAFSRLLCDTTSVMATYNSNHTLTDLGFMMFNPPELNFLSMNTEIVTIKGKCTRFTKHQIVVNKILRSHDQLDMEPLFEWELKRCCLWCLLGLTRLPLTQGILMQRLNGRSFRRSINFYPLTVDEERPILKNAQAHGNINIKFDIANKSTRQQL